MCLCLHYITDNGLNKCVNKKKIVSVDGVTINYCVKARKRNNTKSVQCNYKQEV